MSDEKEFKLSPELAEIVGKDKATRKEVLKAIDNQVEKKTKKKVKSN